jgi:hypothetical protein
MAAPDRIRGARVVKPLERVLPDRLEEAVARLVTDAFREIKSLLCSTRNAPRS